MGQDNGVKGRPDRETKERSDVDCECATMGPEQRFKRVRLKEPQKCAKGSAGVERRLAASDVSLSSSRYVRPGSKCQMFEAT